MKTINLPKIDIDELAEKQLKHLKDFGVIREHIHPDLEYAITDSFIMGFLTAKYLILKEIK